MSGFSKTGVPGEGELLFLPLGGSGEIGMNLNLYGHDGQWLMVDYGISFGDASTPGIDVILPDPSFIEERADQLAGLVLTHAHEDHLGAIPYLWEGYDCPIYATPFTASVLRRKLSESEYDTDAEIIEIPLSGRFQVGKFDLELITLTHSIPEPNALVIRTPVGNVLHTGDWKLDPDPAMGPTTDEAALIRAGEEGILAMVCDSTNALSPGESGSEGDVRENLAEVVAENPHGIVAVACFASNVARLESAARAGLDNGRHVALVGRSLWRMTESAKENGYLEDLPPFLTDEEAKKYPPEKLLYICTGSQGEPRAALSRIARGDHPNVKFGHGDTVIFSSREIPGNEISISRLQNQLVEQGVTLITARDRDIHTSGHPHRDELIQMYQWIRPHIAVPVHGEMRHMVGHAKLARECQVPHGIVPRNGMLVSLKEGGADVLDEVFTGRLALDGNRIVSIDSTTIRDRRKMAYNGFVLVTLVMDDRSLLAGPQVAVEGLLEADDDEWDDLVEVVERAIKGMHKSQLREDGQVKETVRVKLRRKMQEISGKKPQVRVHLVRV